MARKIYFIFSLAVATVFTIYIFQTSFNPLPASVHYHTLKPFFPDLDFSHLEIVARQNNNTGNIPEFYFSPTFTPPKTNDVCTSFPNFYDLKINNDHWQLQETSRGNLYLFNAYLDRRGNVSLVRILAMYERYMPEETLFCQLWYKNGDLFIGESEKLFWMFREKWGADSDKFIHPYLITCPMADSTKELPVSVSLVEEPCGEPSNNLKIFHKDVDTKDRKNFVVCVKGLSFFDDKSARLVEWIELLNLLGAEKINFYEFDVHPYTQRILDYYVTEGKVEVTPLSLVGDVSNRPFLLNRYLHQRHVERRLQEVIPYNDCLYKHLDEYNFIVLLDTDEVIVPVNHTWVELIKTVQELNPNKSTYVARNVYFLDSHLHQHDWFEGIPKYMHILQHVYRANNYTKPGFYVKGFHDVDKVLAVHNHFPLSCLGGCSNSEINITLAHLQHYRADCVKGVGDCDLMKVESVFDARVWNFKEELIERVQRVFKNLKVLKG